MNSLTMTAHADVPGRRQGRSRARDAYQRRTTTSKGSGVALITAIVARRATVEPIEYGPTVKP